MDSVAVDVQVVSGRSSLERRLRARARYPHDTDLWCMLLRSSDRDLQAWPWSNLKTPPIPTGDAGLDGWLELRGACDPARVVAWLTPEVRHRLRALDGAVGLMVERTSIAVFLDEGAEPDQRDVVIGQLREAALSLDRARLGVPVAAELRRWVTVFERLGASLSLPVTTCPLAVEGVIDGHQVLVHAPNWGPFQDAMVLVDVSQPGAPPRRWDLPREALQVRLLRRLLGLLSRVPKASLLEPLLARLRPRPPLGFPPGFVVSGAGDDRIVAATRLRVGRTLDLAGAVRHAIALLQEEAAGRAAGRSPYR